MAGLRGVAGATSATKTKAAPRSATTTNPQDDSKRAPATGAPGGGPGSPTSWWQRDGVIATACAVLSAGAFATTFSTNPAFGDSTESILGTRALGILHAPGYPTYVLLARLFATVFAVGSYAARVNLFSLVCASASIAVCY